MNFSDVFVDSLRYPFSDWRKLLILLIMVSSTIFLGQFILIIIPIGIILNGYLIRIIESTLEGSDEFPAFNDLKKLIIDGIKFIIVSMIYAIPLLVASFISLAFLTVDPNSMNYASFLISLIVGFGVNIIFLMGLSNMVYEKTIFGAFQFRKIISLINEVSWKKYLIYLLFFTLMVEGVDLITLVISSTVIFISPLDIPMVWENHISYSFLAYVIFNGIISTYILIFGSRFRGLIYPIKSLKSENKTNNEA
ncbi:MAG: DUF4013 domain-containing protein [Methanobacteriaceae archaeon]|jgi:hypothetical protein|nr:DUF4013 domain-containing protein [Methanobacteriaceae archaeon]MDO9628139.1 DUF4013 domain-containing protein [Methanobacteriaceae archaeon]